MPENKKPWRRRESKRHQRIRQQLSRRSCLEVLETRLMLTAALWQNPVRPLDVNNDGQASPLDALIVLNHLNRNGGTTELGPRVNQLAPYIDVSGDDRVSPIDVLRVVNALNRSSGREVYSSERLEGESETAPAGFISVVLGTLPGEVPQKVELSTSIRFGGEEFNEMGLFVVDTPQGHIGGLSPDTPGYAEAAFADGRRQVIYSHRDVFQSERIVTFAGGQILGVYVLQKASGVGDSAAHLRVREHGTQSLLVGWEEHASASWLSSIGDRGYDDVTVDVQIGDPFSGNAPPNIAAIADRIADELSEVTVQMPASDPDLPNGDTITYSLVSGPVGATVDPTTGRFSWTPTESQGPGGYVVTVQVTDADGLFDRADFAITVNELNQPPVLATIGAQTVLAGNRLSFTAVAMDSDIPGNMLVYAISGELPAAASFDPSSGAFSWDTTASDIGSERTVTLSVDDQAGGVDSETIVLTVLDPTDQPLTLVEEDRFRTTAEVEITVPAEPAYFEFELLNLDFDTDATGLIRDAFEVALLDPNGRSLVHTIDLRRDSFYNVSEPGQVATGVNTAVDASKVRIDLSHIPAGTPATVVYRLVNNDNVLGDDTATTVTVTRGEVIRGSLGTPVGATFSTGSAAATGPVELETLTDVTGSLLVEYRQTSLNEDSSTLFAGLAVTNLANHPIDGPFVLVIHNLSDPQVVVADPDGVTAEGDRYYLLDDLSLAGTIQPGETTPGETLRFLNPNFSPFSYELTILAQPNRAPEFVSEPDGEGLVNIPYTYDADATDADADALSYQLLSGPTAATIDEVTGIVRWLPTANDVGTHSVVLEVIDGRGGKDTQQYAIEVKESIPNRPPVIVSTPVVEAFLASPYEYNVDAIDPDADPITYQLEQASQGMTIDSVSGLVRWNAAGEQIGIHTVAVTASDGRGGSATQEYQLRVLPDATNTPPVIISEPRDEFFIPGFSNPSSGQVIPQRISVELADGQVVEQTVSITLPSSGTRFADIVIAVDESGSMGGDQAWIAEMVPLLDAALLAEGIGPNRYAMVGFGGGREGIVAGHFLNLERPTKYTLYGPDGKEVDSGVLNQVFRDSLLATPLPQEGRYVLVVEAVDSGDLSGGIDLGFQGNTGTDAVRLPLVFNQRIDDRFRLPGQPVSYEFTLAERRLVYFDSQAKDDRVNWTLSGPGGEVVTRRRFDLSDAGSVKAPVLDLPPGNYTLTIDASAEQLADYQFQLVDLGGLPELPFGSALNGAFSPRNETDGFQFEAAAGDVFRLTPETSDVHPNSRWKLIDPFGNVLIDNLIGVNEPGIAIEQTGAHYLLLEANHSPKEGTSQPRGPSTYTLAAERLPQAPPVPIGLGATVSGTMQVNGQEDLFRFSLPARSLVYFDALTDSFTLHWTLSGPGGTEVNARRFDQTDSFNSANPVLELVAGDYELSVASSGFTGDYEFRVVDLASATPVVPGAPFSGDLDPPNESDFYRFDASTGDTFFFDVEAASDPANTFYRLVDSFGQVVFEQRTLADHGPTTVRADGVYTLLVEGWRSNRDNDTYTLNAIPVVNSSTPMTLGTTVSGTVAEPGEEPEFTFTLPERGLVYFDSLTNRSDITWSLEGPSGSVVSGRRFDRSDSNLFSTPVIDAPAGDYRLTVDGTGDATGDFSFRIADLDTAIAITAGTPLDGELTPPNETDLYRFSADAGDQFTFDVVTASDSIGSILRLVDPFGQVVFSTSSLTDRAGQSLAATGTYTLLVEGKISNTGSDTYTLNAEFLGNTPPPPPSGMPVTLGATISDQIGVAGQRDDYTFTLSQRSLVYFDSLTNSSSLLWTLIGPAGAAVTDRRFDLSDSFNHETPVLDLVAGDYQLSVSASGSATGDYSFRLVDLASAMPITPGAAFSGELTPPNATDFYRFEAVADDRFFFDVVAASDTSNTLYRLFDRFGQEALERRNLTDADTLTLPRTGTYTLLVEGRRANTGDDTYTFNVQPVVTSPTPLIPGQTVSGALATAGAEARYTLALQNRSLIYFDSLTNSSSLLWSLTGPSGEVVSGRRFDQSDALDFAAPVLDLPPGDYELLVDGAGDFTGDFSFRIADLSTATPITAGAPFSGELNPPNETDFYRFDAGPREAFFFDVVTASDTSSNVNFRLVNPFGDIAFTSSGLSDMEAAPLLVGGTHYLIVEGRRTNTGPDTYTINVQPLNTSSALLTLGATVDDSLDTPGARSQYEFNLTQRSLVYFDSLANSSSITWTLAGPGGVQIDARRFDLSDSLNFATPVLDLVAGDYVMTVDGTGDATGPFTFRLHDLANATPITLGTAFSGELTRPNETDLYRFDGVAGDEFFFDVEQANDINNALYRLVDPFGQIVFTSNGLRDVENTILTATGAYTLLVEGRISNADDDTYTLNVQPVTVSTFSLTPDATVAGEIATPGSSVQYAFSLAERSLRVFDSLTSSSSLTWTLTGPLGAIVTSRRFDRSDAASGFPVIDLPAGDYTLTVDATGDVTGPFSFRLLDPANGTAITPSTVVSGSVMPANATVVHQFDVTAGDAFYFDFQALSGFNATPRWRLVDPFGREVFIAPFATGTTADQGPIPLGLTGSYTLLIEGAANDSGATGEFTFHVQPVTDDTVALPLNTTVSGAIDHAGQRDLYTFSLADRGLFYFDSLTNSSSLTWSLQSAGVTLVDQRRFNQSDSIHFATPVLDVPPGDYVLTVDATGDVTGAYAFRLVDLASATPISPNTPFNGGLTLPTETDLYRFDVNAGDRFAFDVVAASDSANTAYRLVSPFGRVLFTSNTLIDRPAETLTAAGAYTLLVEGRVTNTGDDTYEFDLQFQGNDPPPPLTGTPLTLGSTLTGEISAAGELDEFIFSLSERSLVYFDSLTNSSSLLWTLIGPGGAEVVERRFDRSDSFNNETPVLDLPAGDYQLGIHGSGAATGAYSFRIVDLAGATSITPGSAFSGELTPPSTTDFYRFDASAGEAFFFDVAAASDTGNTLYRLFDRFGREVLERRNLTDTDVTEMIGAEPYTLLVEGRVTNTGADTYTLNVQPVTDQTAPLALGSSVAGTISHAGQQVHYTFDLPGRALFAFVPVTKLANLVWTLESPRGVEIDARRFNLGPQFVDLAPGSYTLTVDGTDEFTGEFSFLATAADDSSQLALGENGGEILNAQNQVRVFQFNATAGQRFALTPDLNLGFASAAEAAQAVFVTSADPEDGYSGIDVALRADKFREGAAVNVIMVTDEDRDVLEDNLAFDSVFGDLFELNALLNVVVQGTFRDETNGVALGIDSEGRAYVADGQGGFVARPAGTVNADVSTRLDYIDLAFALEGAAWDLGQLRAGGDRAASFTSAFIDIKVEEILEQLQLDVRPSDPTVGFENLTGPIADAQPGQTVPFDIRLTQDGRARTFDLLFNSGSTIGSIPVVFSLPYSDTARAVDSDGDSLTWSLVSGPTGLAIDSITGELSWPVDQLQFGLHPITIRVEDGRGGFDEQTFTLDVNSGAPGEIRGVKFDDANGDGVFQSTESALEGWTIFLDQNRNGRLDQNERLTVTDDAGRYAFTELPAGTYVVAEVGQPGWDPTAPAAGFHTIALGPGELVTDAGFGSTTIFADNRNPAITSAPVITVVAGEEYRYVPTVSDPDGDPLTFDLPLSPNGMVLDPQNGTLVWNPGLNDIGFANVLLRVRDGKGGLDLQFFTVMIEAPNVAPVITSTAATGPAGVGRPYVYAVRAQDPDGDSLIFALEAGPEGMQIDAATGLLKWTPNGTQIGEHPVTVSVQDGRGGRNEQTFQLSVELDPANDSPTVTSVPRQAIRLGDGFFYQIEVVDSNGDPLTAVLETAPNGMTISENLLVTWTPAANQFGPNDVTIRVEDGRGGEVTQSFTIDVQTQPTNRPPQIASAPPTAATLGRLYQYDVRAEDPEGDPLFWSLVEAPRGMSIDPSTGTVRFNPAAEQLGEHRVIISALDTQGGESRQEYILRVRAANLPPSIRTRPLTEVAVGQTYLYQVGANDPEGDALAFSLTTAPAGMTIDSQIGQIVWTPTAGQVGSHDVEVQISDGAGGIATQRFSITTLAGAANRPPEITSVPSFFAGVEQLYTYDAEATDPEGQILGYRLLQNPAGMTIDPDTGLVRWTPRTADLGTTLVQVLASDPHGAGSLQTFSLTVLAANNPPLITSQPVVNAIPGASYRYDVLANDPDNEPLTYELTTAPAGMIIDGLGRIFWVPDVSQTGAHPVEIRVSDPRGGEAVQQFEVSVTADTTAPQVAIRLDANPVDVGGSVSVLVTAIDNVGVTELRLTRDGQFVPLDVRGQAVLPAGTLGTFTLVAHATDAAGNRNTTTLDLVVRDPNDVDGPNLAITSPSADAVITAPTNVIGTVDDVNLNFYVLSYAAVGSNEFNEIARGTTAVTDGVLGQFDPTLLPNDTYVIRLEGVDLSGNVTRIEQNLSVAGELKLGNFQLSFTDLSIPVNGIPITVARTYDSLNANTQGEFGFGWRMEFRDVDLRVSLPESGLEDSGIYTPFRTGTRVYVTLPGGRREGWTFTPDIRALPGFGNNLILARPRFTPDPGNTSTLSVRSGQLFINEFGELFASGGIPFNPASADFGGGYTITTKEGIRYRVDGSTGKLDSVTDRNGNQLTFDDTGVHDSKGKEITFERDAAGNVTSVIDPIGHRIEYRYDAFGDLVNVTDRENNTTQFVYRDDRPHYLDSVVDPLGRTGVRTDYDDQGRLIQLIDAAGGTIAFTRDPDNRLETVHDQLGHPTTFEYDDRGNVVTQIDALGGVTRRTYDANNFMLTETDPLLHTVSFTYDSLGNMLTRTNPLLQTTRYTYGAFGQIKTTTNALGETSSNTYDARGNRLTATDAGGNMTAFTYDADGNATSRTDALQNVTQYEYDGSGNLTREIDALGHETAFTYDLNGNQLTQTTTMTTPTGVRTLVSSATYDADNRITSETDAEGHTTRTEYNPLGLPSAEIDARGHRTELLYDERGQLTKTIYPDATFTEEHYDARGQRDRSTDQLGRVTHFRYDELRRLEETIYPDKTPLDLSDNPRTGIEYDASGRLAARVDERGHRTEYRFDDADRLRFIFLADNTPDDLSDNPKMETLFDRAGRPVERIDPLLHKTRFEYDALNRLQKTIYADMTSTSTDYDAVGRTIAETDQAGITTRYEYDELGRLVSVIMPDSTPLDLLDNSRTRYEYDEVDNLIRQIDANQHVTAYEYDGVGQRTATVLPLGQQSVTSYDPAGNVQTVTNFNAETISYDHDSLNRLVARRLPDGSSFQFTYTPTGMRETVQEARGTVRYVYDERDRLLSRTEPDGQASSYTYDVTGNQASITTAAGTTFYTFDPLDRLETVTDPDSRLTRYTYDVAGRLIRTDFANGVVETRSYDLLDRLLTLETIGPAGVLQRLQYTLDGTGRRTSLEEDTGRRVAYTYDPLYRLVREDIVDPAAGNRSISYTYDAVGNRLTRGDSVAGVTSYSYDANDRLTSETTGGVDTHYTYDANGNLLSRIAGPSDRAIYHWNAENRLISAEITDSSGTTHTEYEYDADGLRVASSKDAEETRLLLDTNQPYAQVVLEYTPADVVIASYIFGQRLISVQRGAEIAFYHSDALGSVRLLTSAEAVVLNRYIYDAFGRMLSQSELFENVTLFAGEVRDTTLGWDYLRARYYSSSVGRFPTRDAFEGFLNRPLSIHKYSYAHSDPVNNTDPSGALIKELILAAGLFAAVVYFLKEFVAPKTHRVAGVVDVVQYAKVVQQEMLQDASNKSPLLIVGKDPYEALKARGQAGEKRGGAAADEYGATWRVLEAYVTCASDNWAQRFDCYEQMALQLKDQIEGPIVD